MSLTINEATSGYDTERVIEATNEIVEKLFVGSIETINSEIPKCIESVSAIWKGKSAEAFKDKLIRDSNSINENIQELEVSLRKQIYSIMERIDEMDKEAASRIDSSSSSFSSDISSILKSSNVVNKIAGMTSTMASVLTNETKKVLNTATSYAKKTKSILHNSNTYKTNTFNSIKINSILDNKILVQNTKNVVNTGLGIVNNTISNIGGQANTVYSKIANSSINNVDINLNLIGSNAKQTPINTNAWKTSFNIGKENISKVVDYAKYNAYLGNITISKNNLILGINTSLKNYGSSANISQNIESNVLSTISTGINNKIQNIKLGRVADNVLATIYKE